MVEGRNGPSWLRDDDDDDVAYALDYFMYNDCPKRESENMYASEFRLHRYVCYNQD